MRGGGGLGAGGDIFVRQGGTLVIAGGSLAAGTVLGGAGGFGQSADAQNGSAFGTGLFIQGTEAVTLAPGAGQTLTIGGDIVDQTGAGGTGTNAAAGTLVVDGVGTVALDADNRPPAFGGSTAGFSGNILLDAGTLDLAAAGAAGSGPISFAGTGSLLVAFGTIAVPGNAFDNFNAGDTIEVTGFEATGSHYVGGQLTLDGTGGPVALDIPGINPLGLKVTPSGSNTFVTVDNGPTLVPFLKDLGVTKDDHARPRQGRGQRRHRRHDQFHRRDEADAERAERDRVHRPGRRFGQRPRHRHDDRRGADGVGAGVDLPLLRRPGDRRDRPARRRRRDHDAGAGLCGADHRRAWRVEAGAQRRADDDIGSVPAAMLSAANFRIG